MEEPKICILVPMYNVEKYIIRCLKSLVNQTYKNIEVIVINDGSTDGSLERAQSVANKDARIKIYEKVNTKSVADTRNMLLSKISSDYFIFVDSDDYVEKRFVELLYKNMKEKDVDLCGCGYNINFISFPSLKKYSTKKIDYDKTNLIEEMILSKTIHYMLWNKIFKTDLAKGISFSKEVSYGEDMQFCLQYAMNCESAYYFNRPLYHYTVRSSGAMHEKFSNKHIKFYEMLKNMIENETNEKNKQALSIWMAYTSAYFIYLIKKSGTENSNLVLELKSNVQAYDEMLKSSKNLSKLFKISYKFFKFKCKKELA